MDHLNSICIISYENLLIIAKKSRYENDEFRAITLTRIYFLFYSKILWPVHKHIWTKLRPTLISGHDDSKHIFPRFKKLAKEVIEELQKKSLIEREKKHINDILE